MPTFKLTLPFNPPLILFLSIIFNIPDVPSGSYRAEGLVTSSIDSIWDAGMLFKISLLLAPTSVLGLPSIRMVMF